MVVAQLGSILTETVAGATLASAFLALTSAAGWLGVRLFEWYSKWRETQAERRAAIVKFYLDVCITLANRRRVFSQERLDGVIDRIEQSDDDFRAYVESAIDDNVNHRMNELIHTLDEGAMPVVRSYIMYSELFAKQYARTGSEDFARLEKARKILAMQALFEMAATIERLAEAVIDQLCKMGYIADVDRDIRKTLEFLELEPASPAVVRSPEEGGPA